MINVILKNLKKLKKIIFLEKILLILRKFKNIIIYGTPDIVSEKIKSLEKI